ncbi:MAG: hypothetical protein H7Y22_03205 [Gemmatimonadaceae bacterium]|nr:hypothetical protein [Gloeobacterales cyanobacterium ES-bin-141]
MDLEALHAKRELLYREVRELNEQRLVLDYTLRQMTGTDAPACHRRRLLQTEFDELTARLHQLYQKTRQFTHQIDQGLSE